MSCTTAYRHHIHRDTLDSITYTLKTRCNSGISTHLGKIKAHNHSLGNDLGDILANLVADGHPLDLSYTTCSKVSLGHWTWPYTLIPQTLGEPIPYKHTNLKTHAHTYSTTKYTYTPIAQTSKHGACLARAAADEADFTFHKKHIALTHVQFTHKQEFMWGVHNTRLLAHNPTLRCPMCGQFTINGHMAGNCPSMSGLRHDRCASTPPLPHGMPQRRPMGDHHR
jgi:hypothetical protein